MTLVMLGVEFGRIHTPFTGETTNNRSPMEGTGYGKNQQRPSACQGLYML